MEKSEKMMNEKDNDILFSKTVKAGQRIYYLDVKKNRRSELYLSITESKKMTTGPQDMPQVSFEKHKIFLFQEDLQKFQESLDEAIRFIEEQNGPVEQRADTEGEIKIDMDF